MPATHVKCPNCAAPITVTDIDVMLNCGYCGASTTVPDEVRDDPLWAREKRLKEIRQWYCQARDELLVTDRDGNRLPPSKDCPQATIIFMLSGLASFVLSIPVLLVSLLFPPAFLFMVVTFFVPGGIGLAWAGTLTTRAKDRFKKYQQLEADYQARIAELG